MEVVLAVNYFVVLAIVIQAVILRTCTRHKALWRWRTFFHLAAFLWLAMALIKKGYIDDIHPPNDGLLHEATARDIADLLSSGRFKEAFSYFRVGNPAYQFALGVFYAVTKAPEVLTYAINGALGFCGLLALLEIFCRQTHCTKLPPSVVLTFCFLPSGLLWTTTNLKEGPILWCICMMCYWTVPARETRRQAFRILPAMGLLVLTSMRPHIAIAWLLAICVGTALHTRRYGLLAAGGVGVVASVVLLSVLKPDTFEAVMADGATTALSNRYDKLSGLDDGGREPIFGSNPIPVLSGLTLILSRPWPTEASAIDAFLAGLEVWVLGAFGLLNWKLSRGRGKFGLHPALVTHLVLLLLMGFFFSYMYNMGLAVRQRLMCFPAMLAIYTWPLLARNQATCTASRRRNRWQMVNLHAHARPTMARMKSI